MTTQGRNSSHTESKSTLSKSARARNVGDLLLKFCVFIYGFILRLIPEFLIGSYPIGYDTVNYYPVKVVSLKEKSFLELGESPAFYFILWSLYALTRINVISAVKILAPTLYGLLALSFFSFLKSTRRNNDLISLISTYILVSLIPSLRLSWDLLKNVLGMILFFIFIKTILRVRKGDYTSYVKLCIVSLAVALSHPLPTLMMFLICLYIVIRDLVIDRNTHNALMVSLILAPSAAVFSLQCMVFMSERHKLYGYTLSRKVIELTPRVLKRDPPPPLKNYFLYPPFLGSDYSSLVVTVIKLFLIYYASTLPLVITHFYIRARKHINSFKLQLYRLMDILTIWLMIATFSVLICPTAYPFGFFSRHMILLAVPFSFYTADTVQLVCKILPKALKKAALIITLVMYITPGVLYATGSINMRYLAGSKITAFIPENLVQTSIGIEQIHGCIECVEYLNLIANEDSVLIIDHRFFYWVFTYLREDIAIAVYKTTYPLDKIPIEEVILEFKNVYYMDYFNDKNIILANHYNFKEVFHSENVAIYVLD